MNRDRAATVLLVGTSLFAASLTGGASRDAAVAAAVIAVVTGVLREVRTRRA